MRARELAANKGRAPQDVAQADYEQAKLEITGESDPDRQELILDTPAAGSLGDPVPGSVGHKAAETPNEDEDDEGRNAAELLTAQGVDKAELDQIRQAAFKTAKETKPEP